LLAVTFAILSLVLLILPGVWKVPLADAIRGTILRPITALQRESLERDLRLADPARLRAERDSLAAVLVGNAGLMAENRQLRSLLGLQARLPASFVPAEVIRVPSRAMEGVFRLTVGVQDGVRPGSTIVGAAGLIGQVHSVDDHGAIGTDWTHGDFRASAMTVDGEVTGIVEPRRSRQGEPMLALTGAAFHADLPEGTLIVTSGRGGVYPRGIPIGIVAGIEHEEAGWQRSYMLRPMVSPAEMAYVLVLGPPDPRLAGRDLAASWGIEPPEPAPIEPAEIEPPRPVAAQPRPAQQAAPAPRVAPIQPAAPQIRVQPVQPVQPRTPAAVDTPAVQPGGAE
jgi:rod shape-determining protein MreC